MGTPAPARLFVLLAREAPVGVIFRRGPSHLVQVIKWDTKKDSFEPGQWFKGRIYERRSDVSPDGKLIIYLAAKHHRAGSRILPHNSTSWTAISKPPYLTALYLSPDGDTYAGGGLFLSNDTVWYNNTSPADGIWSQPHENFTIISKREIYFENGIYYKHLEADGWIVASKDISLDEIVSHPAKPSVWTKQRHNITLLLTYTYNSASYRALNKNTGDEIQLSEVTWADFDQKDRLVFAKAGKLFTAKLNRDKLQEQELADFNANTFKPIIAPEWAKTW